MSEAFPLKPNCDIKSYKVLIVASRYNELYTDALIGNCRAELMDLCPNAQITLLRVPGAFEVPVGIAMCLQKKTQRPDAVIALGVIIKGSTDHADLIGTEVTSALQAIALKEVIPVIHEVLLVEDEQQAQTRCIEARLNRGREAARAAASMLAFSAELAPTF